MPLQSVRDVDAGYAVPILTVQALNHLYKVADGFGPCVLEKGFIRSHLIPQNLTSALHQVSNQLLCTLSHYVLYYGCAMDCMYISR